ncbi:MAG: holin [Oscillospiraceae bacterium]|nr:holin [Oscillospiraceae bacterium]
MQAIKIWLRAASIRAVRTMAQTAAAIISTKAVLSEVNWQIVVSAVALSGILSVLTALAGLPECKEEDK